ncbi:MAG: anti-sigma factor family protein [Candidatus Krumholzibacteriia bacterium]
MHCEEFERRLDDLVAAELTKEELQAAEEHRSRCSRCANLLEVVRGEREALAGEAGERFVGSLLQNTAGSPCTRAREQLCSWGDGELEEADAQLVSMHVEHCSACADLATALVALRSRLGELAEVEPDAGFVTGVLQATRGMRRRRLPLGERIRETGERLLQRPRLAWELATAGSFALLLLCGTPGSPFRDMPRQALAITQINPVQVAHTTLQRLQPVLDEYGARAWQATAGRIADKSRDAARSFGADHQEAARAWTDLRGHTRALRQAVSNRNLAQASRVMHEMRGDFKKLWRGLRTTVPSQDSQSNEHREEEL